MTLHKCRCISSKTQMWKVYFCLKNTILDVHKMSLFICLFSVGIFKILKFSDQIPPRLTLDFSRLFSANQDIRYSQCDIFLKDTNKLDDIFVTP